MILDQFFISEKSDNKKSLKASRNSEAPVRSIAKSISWRVVGSIDTLVISWLLTGEVAMALQITSVEFITKMVLYFFHERLWNVIKWGK
jgi:uncharacterized membrane protein